MRQALKKIYFVLAKQIPAVLESIQFNRDGQQNKKDLIATPKYACYQLE